MPVPFSSLANCFGSAQKTSRRRRQTRSLCESIESLETRVLLSGTGTVDPPPAEVDVVPNTPPVVTGPPIEVVVNENAESSVFDLSNFFSDAEDAELSYHVEVNANPGLVTATINGSTLTLDYAANQSGGAFIAIQATDSGGLSVGTPFFVTVSDVNNEPTVANPVGDVTVDEDADNTVIDLSDVFADAEDSDLDLSVELNTNGELVDVTLDGTMLTLDYAANQSGTSQITLRATDSGGKFVETTFLVTVNSVNDVPTVENSIADVTVERNAENTVIDISGTFADVEDEELTLTVRNSNGDLLNATLSGGLLTLDYVAGQTGNGEITVRGTDSDGEFVETTFQVTVNGNGNDCDGDDDRSDRRARFFARLRRVFEFIRNRGRAGIFWGFGWRLR